MRLIRIFGADAFGGWMIGNCDSCHRNDEHFACSHIIIIHII